MEDPKNSGRYGWPAMILGGVALNVIANILATTREARIEYSSSTRPWFAPPAWAFGVVWPINNLMTLWANRCVLNAPPSRDRTAYLRLQASTWALFTTYGFVRFRLRSPILGCTHTSLYLVLTLASAVRAERIDRRLLASLATLIPWLLLATALSVYQLGDSDSPFEG
ncbi:MAG TPA: TspO/MBR family protein [Candidatus Baltobacteraceae bacterium]|jgi:tryptophan-rich sensory protein|nr:TspO/MBR family protein [Candidatus Baltobacteraceae bacterium]